MNSLRLQTRINEKLSNLSSEQLNTVLEFIESIEILEAKKKAPQQTIIEKMGGYPEFLLEGSENLSDRDVRKKTIAKKIKEKHQKRHT
ncbi:hypothetical protein [Crocosphaera chwakensis]|uniref:DUF2281 domain-containing protein n=1 Tax=Crocosphaera chwakensis CCY0110 TaxID=391612 RepID=A3IT46_9CHRO|nr:hypothetical protein [Crocosphaera chwakensis]EAZ90350.1 hypothetical protein CY0110_04768 [Crocosphaera chwakensis CCY0110]